MNIREMENELFSKWREKYKNSSFVIDGCPNPAVYLQEKRKVVFVLKDANLGEPESLHSLEERIYDQRDELEIMPNMWWKNIARWSYSLRNEAARWELVEEKIHDTESIRESLSHHCIMQLKKTWGGGSVENSTLDSVVIRDRTEIVSQLAIYEPQFIIACGNGDHLAKIFNCKKNDFKKTSSGVGYWKIELNNKICYVIDYCHPSNRAGTKVKGLIAIGLGSAISQIEKTPNNYMHTN